MTVLVQPINCTLKAGDAPSSTDAMIAVLRSAFENTGAAVADTLRIANYDIKPGETSDEGDGDQWPTVREAILEADVLVLGGPIWMGQPSSVCKRVLERMDAFLYEKDERDRMPSYGRLGLVAVVGNEDGAHHVSAELFQGLNDVGFTLPPNAVTYWVGEAMGDKDYKDFKTSPKVTTYATTLMVAGAAHLAGLLKRTPYPGLEKKK